jgi:hypothetical protein
MRASRAIAFAITASLALSSSGRAGTLITHPVSVPTNHNFLCVLVNEGKKPVRDAVVEVVRYASGPATVASSNDAPELAPFQSLPAEVTHDELTTVFLCRFTFRGGGKSLRGSGILRNQGGDFLDSQPAR